MTIFRRVLRTPYRAVSRLMDAQVVQARRNALIAYTALASRRVERQEVSNYLEGLERREVGARVN